MAGKGLGRDRLAGMTPEQRAKVEAIRAKSRTPERRAEEATIRERFADRPGVPEMIAQGDIDPARGEGMTMGALRELHGVRAELAKIREARGVTMTDVAKASRMPLSALTSVPRSRRCRASPPP